MMYNSCMARPRSDDKRSAILEAATQVFVARGLGAPTALIAKEAGVASGTLFTYFETKAVLINQLYFELKSEMAEEATKGLNEDSSLRELLHIVWRGWTSWALTNPERRRVLALLGVSDEITPETRAASALPMQRVGELIERIRANGPMRDAPRGLVAELMSSLADATMDYAISDPEHADSHCEKGFDALWRVIG